MVAREVIVNKQIEALKQVLEVTERLDPDAVQELRSLTPSGMVPNSARSLDETILFMAQCTAVLAKTVDQQVEASKPKKRGRPKQGEK